MKNFQHENFLIYSSYVYFYFMSFPMAATKFNLAQPHFHLPKFLVYKQGGTNFLSEKHAPFFNVVEKLIIALLQHYITVDYNTIGGNIPRYRNFWIISCT